MAHATLAVSPLLEFPQVLHQALAGIDQILPLAGLSPCCYEPRESNQSICDSGYPCWDLGPVHPVTAGMNRGEDLLEEVCCG